MGRGGCRVVGGQGGLQSCEGARFREAGGGPFNGLGVHQGLMGFRHPKAPLLRQHASTAGDKQLMVVYQSSNLPPTTAIAESSVYTLCL